MDPILESLLQYGIAGATFAAMMMAVVVPITRAFIRSQHDQLMLLRDQQELLRKAVSSNTEAVRAFQRFEERESETHERILAGLNDIRLRVGACNHSRTNGGDAD